jgi:hypothetical protein
MALPLVGPLARKLGETWGMRGQAGGILTPGGPYGQAFSGITNEEDLNRMLWDTKQEEIEGLRQSLREQAARNIEEQMLLEGSPASYADFEPLTVTATR